MKKVLVIILCVLATVLTALATVLMFIKTAQKVAVSAPLSHFSSNETESAPPLKTEEPKTYSLTFKSPANEKFTTTNETVTFSGNYAPDYTVTLNGEEIKTDKNGDFTVTKNLQYGNNQFTFCADNITKTFTVTRRYIVINSHTPSTAQTFSAGAKFPVSVIARQGAQVTAAFNGTTINLTESGTANNGFSTFSGSFTMPSGHFTDLNLGTVTFKGSYNGYSETFYSGNVTCKKEDIVVDYDPNATPKGGIYTNVGSGIITEIVAYQAETFDAGTKKDTSEPSNNYLPKGTVDYGSADTYTVKRDGDTYELVTLRCGRTVYKSMRDKPSHDTTVIVNQYVGILPDHNEITFNSLTQTSSHTVLSLGIDWKAPFYFDLSPQSYNGDGSIANVTYNYVDITFCYATVFEGEIVIPQDNPLFSSAKLIKNTSDYTLRLYLKKQGGFYGWDSYYDTYGNLCFEFLNPAKVTETNLNEYGADLTGVSILIDVGHGGIDGGAVKSGTNEANCNLLLANKIKAELLKTGATVYMTRTGNVTSTLDDKLTMLKRIKPDYCIAVHHDSNNSSRLNGFGSYYYTPFSKKAAEYILDYTFNTGIYKDKTFKFHKYFTARSSVCPVVLTENGYMSNSYDYGNIINDSINTQKAIALTKGIVQYFLSIQ